MQYLLANVDSLMMNTLKRSPTEPTRQVLLHQPLFKSNKNTVISSKEAIAAQGALKYYASVD